MNADYLTENNGEGLFFFAKIAPYVDQLREDGSPRVFKNVEWATKESETGRQMFAHISEMVQKRIESD